jgi:hypothetical protein
VLAISGFDRSRRVSLAGWESPRQLGQTASLQDQLAALVGERLTGVAHTVVFDNVFSGIPSPVVLGASPGGDPWREIVEMGLSGNLAIAFAGDGRLVFSVADPAVRATVFELTEGEGGTTIDRQWEDSDEGVYNAIFMTGGGGGGGQGIVASAVDLDPTSPTYYYGPSGRRAQFVAASSIAANASDTAAAAQAFADLALRKTLGTNLELAVQCVPLPFLAPSDLVRVTTGEGISMTMEIVGMAVPLDVVSSMEITVRRVVLS